MLRVLDDLRGGYRSLRKHLELLDQQIKLVTLGRQPDGELLLELAEFFGSVHGLFHQPKEDLVVNRIADRAPDAADEMEVRAREQDMERQARDVFAHAAVGLLLDAPSGRDRFLDAAQVLSECLRRHIQWAEQRLFRLAEHALTHEDWADVASRLAGFPCGRGSVQGRRVPAGGLFTPRASAC
jgi:hemerythrin-like domain-containing protein